MANHFFRFKQFAVYQDQCAMKVCTDACLFGAWLAPQLANSDGYLLDVGAGTGLLTLMVAQKTTCTIHGVEIDEAAYLQSCSNIEGSPWRERLSVFHIRVQEFQPGFHYDAVFSNPPFYASDLPSDNLKRNVARHDTSLTLRELLDAAYRLLKPGGQFALLLPAKRMMEFEGVAAGAGFSIIKKVAVKPDPMRTPFRYIYLLNKSNAVQTIEIEELIIKDGSGAYTEKFFALLKDYYLFEKKAFNTFQ